MQYSWVECVSILRILIFASMCGFQERERQLIKDEKIKQMAMAQKAKMAQKNEQRLRLR